MEAEVAKSNEELESALEDARRNLELELSKTTSLEQVRFFSLAEAFSVTIFSYRVQSIRLKLTY